MTRKVRSGILLFAGLTMIMSSIGGCASSGAGMGGATPREVSQPYSDSLQYIPGDTPVRVELLSGRIVEGLFLSYSPAVASVQFQMKQVGNSLSDEFNEEGRIYTIPEEKIVNLNVLESPDPSRTTGVIVVVAVVLSAAFVAYVSALSHANGN